MAPNAGMLHIACHGVFDSKNPEFSTLFLAHQGDDDGDGRLEMHEIFGLNLDNCSLITLSACESALGGISGGDEIIGLNRAFIYAGSPRVISTLWEVDDLGTAVLMKKFYRHIRAGLSPSEALRLAQQHVRRRIHSHPAYWAAFILTGEPGHLPN
jgi:CHAT domain-containing protein